MDLFGFFIIWFLLCWGVGAIAGSRYRSGMGYFLLSMVLSPLIGLIVVLVLPNRKEEQQRAAAEERNHERRLEEIRALTAAQAPKPAPAPPRARSTIDDLERLASLKASGALTEEEFQRQKAAILSRPT